MLQPYFFPGFSRRLILVGGLVLSLMFAAIVVVANRNFFSTKNKPTELSSSALKLENQAGKMLQPRETKVIEVNNRFTYDPKKRLGIGSLSNYNPNEPAFSLKLPDGWILRKPDSPINRVLTISPNSDPNSPGGRAILGVNILKPQADNLAGAAKAEKEQISQVGEDRYFFTEKETRLNGQAVYFLEYKIKLGGTNETGQQWDHHVDIFTISNGYLIDLYASAQEKDWARFVETVEKSINTFRVLTN